MRSPHDDVENVVDLEQPLPSKGADLPCSAAIEFLADIYEMEGGESTLKATEVDLNVSILRHFVDQVNSSGNH
jgi:protein farnesyltransferase/geranylgeranyltransferase type-1 subunit alpha